MQLKRYGELKEQVHQQAAGLSQQAEKMNWEVRSDHEKILSDQRRKKEVEVPEDLNRRPNDLVLGPKNVSFRVL